MADPNHKNPSANTGTRVAVRNQTVYRTYINMPPPPKRVKKVMTLPINVIFQHLQVHLGICLFFLPLFRYIYFWG